MTWWFGIVTFYVVMLILIKDMLLIQHADELVMLHSRSWAMSINVYFLVLLVQQNTRSIHYYENNSCGVTMRQAVIVVIQIGSFRMFILPNLPYTQRKLNKPWGKLNTTNLPPVSITPNLPLLCKERACLQSLFSVQRIFSASKREFVHSAGAVLTVVSLIPIWFDTRMNIHL